ncbi:hypothetical protein HispidOSU_026992 [Sigmodon hispidus]
MLKILLLYVAKNSSVKMNDLDAHIVRVAYAFQKDKLLTVHYLVEITKDSEDIALGEMQLVIAHDSKISKNKLVPAIKLKSSENTVDPSEAKDEVGSIMTEIMNKAWSVFNEMYKQMNIPEGLSSFSVKNVNVKSLQTNHLQATN